MRRTLTPTESMARAFVTLRGADENDPKSLSAAVRDATAEIRTSLADSTYSKAQAAHLLDVSATTLDNWIDRGLLPVVQVPRYRRDRIPAAPLLTLASEVEELRRLGRRRGLLVEALSRLEAEDPAFKSELNRLYGRGMPSGDSDEYVSAEPGPDFGPDD